MAMTNLDYDRVKRARIDKGLYWDRAWSLVEGCTPVSPGCAHCWSAQQADVRGHWTGKTRLMEQDLDKPLRVKKPTTWAIWNDLFHKDVPDSFIIEAFARMTEAHQHTFQILTKRSDRIVQFMHDSIWGSPPLKNVWLGITIESQDQMWRLVDLGNTPAAIRYVSHEPLLSAIDYDAYSIGPRDANYGKSALELGLIDWVVCGAETGPGKRPMELDWARSIRDQCKAAGVPFFMKKASSGDVPSDLMIREFPR